MQYISPIRFWKYCNIDSQDDNISRIKKVVLAEFAATDNGIIEIDGYDYSKQSVLTELDEEADFNKKQTIHQSIWNNKPLLAFLEKGDFDISLPAKMKELALEEHYRSFISSYFASSFNYVMGQCLQSKDFGKAMLLLNLKTFIANADQENAYVSTRSFFKSGIYFFRNINSVNFVQVKDQLLEWTKMPWELFLNALPENFYYEYGDELIRKVINTTVEIQKKDRNLTYLLSCRLQDVNTSDELKKLLVSNHKIYLSHSKYLETRWKKHHKPISKLKFLSVLIGCMLLFSIISVVIAVAYNYYQKTHIGIISSKDFRQQRELFYNIRYSSNTSPYQFSSTQILRSFDPIYFLFDLPDNQEPVLHLVNKTPYDFSVYSLEQNNKLDKIVVKMQDSANLHFSNRVLDVILVINNFQEVVKKDSLTFYGLFGKYVINYNNLKLPGNLENNKSFIVPIQSNILSKSNAVLEIRLDRQGLEYNFDRVAPKMIWIY